MKRKLKKKKKRELIINFIYWLQNFLVYQDKSGVGDDLSFFHLLLFNRDLLRIQGKVNKGTGESKQGIVNIETALCGKKYDLFQGGFQMG